MLAVIWLAVLACFARPLWARWREPAFSCPILILESDDWGAGPTAQADALTALTTLLDKFRNRHQEKPVVTLGIVLEVADRDAMRVEESIRYIAASLESPSLIAVLKNIKAGISAGVFAPQLHGAAHFWPDTLMRLATTNTQVHAWLAQPGLGWTEELPAAVQSRWIDVSTLPSLTLDEADVKAAVANEIKHWTSIFGAPPTVAVPTTFVWTEAVETALANAGIQTLVTPGARYPGRGADGRLVAADRMMLNGDRGDSGILFVVRDIYFEPALGHTEAGLLEALAEKIKRGRPALAEMHRFNFCGPNALATSYDVLAHALETILARWPDLRFMSTEALANHIRTQDPRWIECGLVGRLSAWAWRALDLRDFRRVAMLSGLILPLLLLQRL